VLDHFVSKLGIYFSPWYIKYAVPFTFFSVYHIHPLLKYAVFCVAKFIQSLMMYTVSEIFETKSSY